MQEYADRVPACEEQGRRDGRRDALPQFMGAAAS
jgi:hypothetical protein